MSDTAELVVRARDGDQVAFGALYDRHARLVRAICYDATAHMASAEDLTQEVFLKAYQRLSQLREADRFLPWLCEIARRAGNDWRRRPRREVGFPDEWSGDEPAAQREDPQIAELRDAIRQLPEDERMALHLFYLEEQPVVVARELLGLSQSGFYKVLERARNHAGSILRRNQESIR
jgi:RNA polymerase sigma-70 factor (ECF subfamily)